LIVVGIFLSIVIAFNAGLIIQWFVKLAFDLVRASVNLVVASILIAIGTSFKLPLSTTYVTFMVAMGTSLAGLIRLYFIAHTRLS